MQKTKIEWCDYTWNPVTGCRRGCEYCYAKRVHDRFYSYPFSDIRHHADRLNDPSKLKKPATIFVGSMSDIEYWNKGFTNKIIAQCAASPRHTFMFLSKNPKSYNGFSWPENTMQGLTLTCEQSKYLQGDLLLGLAVQPRPYLSIEPLLGRLEWRIHRVNFKLVIVGAMTGPGAVAPEQKWVESIKEKVLTDIFWKENIKKYVDL